MSKRIINHPPAPDQGDAVTVYRSVGEKERTPLFEQWLQKEFPTGSSEMDEEERQVTRRSFTKLMGASTALAGLGLTACRRPEAYIVPYKKAPEWVIPGKPLFYATSMPRPEGAVPLVVTTYEERPTKLEPNNDHPENRGTDAFVQASVLDLYSPFRSKKFLKSGKVTSKKAANDVIKSLDLAKTAFIFGADDSPTRNRLAKALQGKGATLISYEPLVGEGRREALGAGVSLNVDFEKADRVLSLDCDFLGTDVVGNPRAFATKRQGGETDYQAEIDKDKMNRLYQIETTFSLTGGMADHRLRMKPSQVLLVAADIAKELGVSVSFGASAEDKGALFPGGDGAALYDQWVRGCADDLKKNKGLVVVGSRREATLHTLAAKMNAAIKSQAVTALKTGLADYEPLSSLAEKMNSGAVENLVILTPADPVFDAPGFSDLLDQAKTSIHLGTRTNHTAWAADWHIPAAHYLATWGDTRSANGTYNLIQPMILPLYGGIAELDLVSSFVNGTDLPAGDFSPAMLEVKTTFAEVSGKKDDAAWKNALKEGFLAGSQYEEATIEVGEIAKPAPAEGLEIVFSSDSSVWDGRYIDNAWMQESPDPVTKLTWDNAAQISPQTAKDLGIYDEVVALETPTAEVPVNGEGTSAHGIFVSLEVNDAELIVPVVIAFGHADGALTLPVGYGQAADDGRQGAAELDVNKPVVGLVGINTGFNTYKLRTAEDDYFASGVQFQKTKEKYPIALTQEHHSMYGRALAREISTQEIAGKGIYEEQLAKVKKHGVDSHAPPNISLYKPKGSSTWHKDKDQPFKKPDETHLFDEIHQWGMSIDLNTCTGCNACLVSCQAENNIPVVGKTQVAMGREMHWIRMDRYFASQTFEVHDGHIDQEKENPAWVQQNPEMMPQPVACVQCELAPCETVCPVNATVHTEEGLNSMAYNRCIGTRYCANNCPYKARRFNFFDYNKRNPLIKKNLYKGPFGEKTVGEPQHLQRNPNVTVRMRGVMEKCSYCVQRLEGAKIKQKQQVKYNVQASGKKSTDYKVDRVKDLRIKTDSVKTACQDACPTNAISFGNLLDNNARVTRAKGNDLDSIRTLYGDKYEENKVVGSQRNYDLLNYVNTRPRTSYLARVKNPNPAMPDAKYLGQATINVH